MKLIIIYGAPAVGKLTTANGLSKKTGYSVLHNHMTIDLMVNYFPFNSNPFIRLLQKIRLDIIKELLVQKASGLILTSGFDNAPETKAFYRKLDNLIKKHHGTVHYIKLVCHSEEQKKRVVARERKKYKKPSTVGALTKVMRNLDFSKLIPGNHTLVIDNTHLSLSEVVLKIYESICK